MIEDALFLALGFCGAVVLAIALLPLLWARALRLTTQRLELLVPWSKGEIDAERDGIRAQAAVEHRRLEQQAERSRAALATRDAVLGQRTVAIVKLEAERDALTLERENLKSDLAQQRRACFDAEGQRFAAEKALHDADRRIETDAAEARAQAERLIRTSTLAEERRGTIASLEIRVAGLMATAQEHEEALRRGAVEAARHQSELGSLTERHRTLGADHSALQRSYEDMREQLVVERRTVAERDRHLQGHSDDLAAAKARITEQDAAMKQANEDRAALQKRFDDLTAELMAHRDRTGRDAALRTALVAAGDDALRLLADPPARDDARAGDPAILIEDRP